MSGCQALEAVSSLGWMPRLTPWAELGLREDQRDGGRVQLGRWLWNGPPQVPGLAVGRPLQLGGPGEHAELPNPQSQL